MWYVDDKIIYQYISNSNHLTNAFISYTIKIIIFLKYLMTVIGSLDSKTKLITIL